jgi:predicted DNA-binding protein (UPF0251 family)
MPRPTCPRKISHSPPANYFKPAGIPLRDLDEVLLAADELEALRLADCEGLYHADAAGQMGISRQTFDRIIRRARGKAACALVRGRALRIERPAGVPANAAPAKRTSPASAETGTSCLA